MIDYENIRLIVAKGLKQYLGCQVIRSNQNAEPPAYPYVSYTVTTLASANNGTYGEWDDGKARKAVTSTWSITALSDDNAESVMLAMKAREWLEFVGTTYLNDNKVVVQSVGGITNRDNVLTYDYEYRNGFDCVFWCFDEIEIPQTQEFIEAVEMGEDTNAQLESRLDGVDRYVLGGSQADNADNLNDLLADRLDGVE